MPQKDDYLQRLFEQIAETLAAIAGLKNKGYHQQARDVIQQAYQQHFASSAQLIHLLTTEDLIAMLSTAHIIDSSKAFLLAELLKSEAEVSQEMSGDRLEDSLEKALNLYIEALLGDTSLMADITPRIKELLGPLDVFALARPSQQRLFTFYVLSEEYARAEDILYIGLEASADPDWRERGQRFYRDLLLLSDEALEAGGLPREEVIEGQQQLLN